MKMLKFALLSWLWCVSSGISDVQSAAVERRVYPYFVSIRTEGLSRPHHCSGSIVSDRWILTAATCLPSEPDIRSLSGMYALVGIDASPNYGRRYLLEQYLIHPDFELEDYRSNVALLRTQKPMQFDVRTQSIALATSFVEENSTGSVVGYNQTAKQRDRLRQGNVTVIRESVCREQLDGAQELFLTNYTICVTNFLGEHDIGTAMVHTLGDGNGVLTAIASFVFEFSTDENDPNIYVQIAPFTKWITKITNA